MSKKRKRKLGRAKNRVAIWVPKINKYNGKFLISFQMTVNGRAIIYAHNDLPPVWWTHKMDEKWWRFLYAYCDFGGYLK